MSALEELDAAYERYRDDPAFLAELRTLQTDYAGRPTPLFRADRLSARAGCRVYLKREDLAHTGAHKINNTLGQILLATRMGKTRIIAETGAGQHGVATATVAALFGLECHVYMGEEDIRRQELNVFRMRLLGAEVLPVTSGSGTLKDATNEAIRDWVANVGEHPLHHRVGGRACAVPGHGAGLPVGHRRGDPRPGAGEGRPAPRRPGRLRGRGQQRHRHVPRVRGRARGAHGGRRGGGPRPRLGQARRLAGARRHRYPPRLLLLRPAGRGRPDPGGALHRSRPRLPVGGAGARLPQGLRAGGVHVGHRRAGSGGLPGAIPARGDHPRPGELARHRLSAAAASTGSGRRTWWWSACPAAETRTSTVWPASWGWIDEREREQVDPGVPAGRTPAADPLRGGRLPGQGFLRPHPARLRRGRRRHRGDRGAVLRPSCRRSGHPRRPRWKLCEAVSARAT